MRTTPSRPTAANRHGTEVGCRLPGIPANLVCLSSQVLSYLPPGRGQSSTWSSHRHVRVSGHSKQVTPLREEGVEREGGGGGGRGLGEECTSRDPPVFNRVVVVAVVVVVVVCLFVCLFVCWLAAERLSNSSECISGTDLL